jgi:hypothetical protein
MRNARVIADDCSRRRSFRIGRWLAAALLVGSLAGCGTQFVYNRLGWLTHYYLSSHVSLDGSQSSELRANLREFFVWHRRTELPRYASFLDRFAAAAGGPLTREQLESGSGEIESFVRASITHGAPDAARWLDGLRPQQLDELFANLEKKEQESRKEHCSVEPAKRREKSVERFIENVEDWTGRLRRVQRELIAERLAKTSGDPCLDLSAQERSRIEFRALVDRHRGQPDFAERIATFMTRPEDRWDAAYKEAYAANRAIIFELIADLDRTMTAEQRRRAVSRLREFARNLRKLAAEPADSVNDRGEAREKGQPGA